MTDDLSFWAALPPAARARIATALRDNSAAAGASERAEEATGGRRRRGEGDANAIDNGKSVRENEKLGRRHRSFFRPPPKRGVTVVPHLISPTTAAQAAIELEELLSERGRPGGVAGGGRGKDDGGGLSLLVRSDVSCWLGTGGGDEGEDEDSSSSTFPKLPPALAAARSALLALRPLLSGGAGGEEAATSTSKEDKKKSKKNKAKSREAQTTRWDVGGRPSVMAARYDSGGRYARHVDEQPSDDDDGDDGDDGGGGGGDRSKKKGGGRRRRKRTITAICYLDDAGRRKNNGDGESGGGELVLYPWSSSHSFGDNDDENDDKEQEPKVVVAPSPGLAVVFDSTVPHEVTPLIGCRGPRRAVTVFFYSSVGDASDDDDDGEEKAEAMTTATTAATTAASRAQRNTLITRPGHIFVSVPSFRDPETRWTLRSLFESADDPRRVTAGVVWQVKADGSDDDLLRPVGAGVAGGSCPASPLVVVAGEGIGKGDEESLLYRSRVREARLPDSDATGPCAARATAASLWRGEEFYLSIDAHSRFAKGWDSKLKRTLALAEGLGEGYHPVLTSYPPAYEGVGPSARIPDDAGDGRRQKAATLLCASHFGPEGVLRLVGRRWRWKKKSRTEDLPIRSLFWAAGFSFSRAHFAVSPPTRYGTCPDDASGSSSLPCLFWGEEHDVAARAMSAGYRFWSPPPSGTVVYTRYERSGVRGDPPLGARGSASAAEAGARIAEIFSADADVAGMWRSLGVDWATREVTARARKGGVVVGCGDEEVEFCDEDEDGGFSVV